MATRDLSEISKEPVPLMTATFTRFCARMRFVHNNQLWSVAQKVVDLAHSDVLR